ncbi:PL29 family lyase N-terminal domain-containing protein [Bacteroides finegoldii]|jgi:hypothetical protein|uniref:PL29 family lyase N-terminal domain-containing protein n=1 Tax=Bacteroides finegoldii TaxID=338188 RepID=UPI00234C0F57|nr:PL29 family lyase N-terminal domain-containing protein [Bacteroides finegoldii]MDC7139095.1 PL29 family lyase N-terminal domain-containing protein [Bacteroides finegoldii]
MKYIKLYILFFLMIFAVTGCTTDDLKDDVNDLKDRVTLIEEQVKLLNDNLAVIAYILDTQNKTISEVKNVTDNGEVTQKKIVLSDGTELTLTIGKPGTINEPEVTVGEDKMWYINGEPTGVIAIGEPGKNGEGYPEFRVQDGDWQVRFGDGEWKPVTGGENVADGSLGDQFFVKAEVVDDNFVVTMTDGTVHTLPIVADLACAIDKTSIGLDEEGFWVIEKDTRVEVLVKITGENPQVTYPQGWRATLSELETADDKGNNYKLYIYAPAATIKTMNTRAAANNTSDITVQVQKGSLWAVDKIKVKTPKELNTNEGKYNDGQAIRVGGLEITRELYGDIKAVPADGKLTEGGVYFISENGKELTCGFEDGVQNLIILPNTEEVTEIKLEIGQKVTFTGTFACQNVIFNCTIKDYPLWVQGGDKNVVFDKCQINGLIATKGLLVSITDKNVDGTDNLNRFEMSESKVEIKEAGTNLYLINTLSCKTLKFDNNIVYYSGTPSQDNNLENFKVFNGKDNHRIDDLVVTRNTFIDIESSYTGNNIGLFYPKTLGTAVVDNNIYYFSSYREYTAFLIRVASPNEMKLISSVDNYAYVGDSSLNFNVFQNKVDDKTISFTSKDIDLFDTKNTKTFDKSTGTFIPKDEYKAYGAQR